MGSTFAIALSGMRAAELRLGTSAHNVANALTEGFQPLAVASSEAPGGGVESRVVPANDPAVESRIDAAVLAGGDLAGELVGQAMAAAAFRANLASLRAADELVQSLVQVRG
jgi:flagellar hook protein FlgE